MLTYIVPFIYIWLKTLVRFWWINETLSANLVYQSDYKIGSTTPSDKAMVKIMMMVMIKCLNLEKKKEKNKKLKAKVKLDRNFFVLVIETLSECDHI